ncbi:MAG: tetratricopeptide repeat protein [Chloroflexi bacterium]|nr:tetratricopeptide repeat protein [Chloroflexota bacterium]
MEDVGIVLGIVVAVFAIISGIYSAWRRFFGRKKPETGSTGDHSPVATDQATQVNNNPDANVATDGSTIIDDDSTAVHRQFGDFRGADLRGATFGSPVIEGSDVDVDHRPVENQAEPHYWRNRPADDSEHFYGRQDQFGLVVEHLRSGSSVLLAGGAGVGKSRLAVEASVGVGFEGFWISLAGRELTSDALLAVVAVEMGIPIANESEAAREVETRLASRAEPLAIVFDNLASVDVIAELAGRIGGRTRLLMTTRDSRVQRVPPAVETVQMDVIDLDAAVQLLCSRSRPEGTRSADDETIRDIARAVGRLPLALEMLAVQIGNAAAVPTRVLEQLNAEPETAGFKTFLDESRYQDVLSLPRKELGGVYTAIRTSLLAIPDADLTAIAPLGLLADSPASRSLAMSLMGTDEHAFERLASIAARQSVVRIESDRQSVAVHLLTASVIRTLRPTDPRALLEHVISILDYAINNQPLILASDFIHYRRLYELTEGQADDRVLRFSNSYASALRARGQFQQAIRIHETTLEALGQRFGDEHANTLAGRNNLAFAYRVAGRIAEAIPLYETTLDASERTLGDDHPSTLMSRGNLASGFESAGRLWEAIPLHERTLEAWERMFGDEFPSTLTSRNNLAGAYASVGRLTEAINLYESTLGARERTLGEEHPDTLGSRNNLAGAYALAGRLTEAFRLYETTFEVMERTFGAEHPDTLTCRNNLAGVYESTGHLGLAIPLFESTLRVMERTLGGGHPGTLTNRNNLASAYLSAGRVSEAIQLSESTLDAMERILGSEHHDTLTSRNNLASAYRAAGRFPEAISLHELTLKTRERSLGDEHPDTLVSRNNLAGAYESVGRLSEAIPLYESTLKMRERTLGSEHPDSLTSGNNLASAYALAGRIAGAVPLFESTLKVRERTLGPEHPDTIASRNNLAGVYALAGRMAEAIPLLEATLESMERTLGDEHPRTLTQRSDLAVAYQATGRHSQSIPLMASTLVLREQTLGDEHVDTVTSRSNLAVALGTSGQIDQAIKLLRNTLDKSLRDRGENHPSTTAARNLLNKALEIDRLGKEGVEDEADVTNEGDQRAP